MLFQQIPMARIGKRAGAGAEAVPPPVAAAQVALGPLFRVDRRDHVMIPMPRVGRAAATTLEDIQDED